MGDECLRRLIELIIFLSLISIMGLTIAAQDPTHVPTPITATPSPTIISTPLGTDQLELLTEAYNSIYRLRHSDARSQFNSLIRTYPDWIEPQRGLAEVSASRGLLSDAIEPLEAAIALGADDASVYYELADAYNDESDVLAAESAIRKAVERAPSSLLIQRLYADIARQNGRTKDAINHYLAALALDPENTGIFSDLLDLLTDAWDEDGDNYLDPGLFYGTLTLALDFHDLGLNSEALAYYQDALDFAETGDFPFDEEGSSANAPFSQRIQYKAPAVGEKFPVEWVYYNRARLYLDAFDDADAALNDIESALELAPDFAYAIALRGVIYERNDDHDQARQDILTASRLAPDNATLQRKLFSHILIKFSDSRLPPEVIGRFIQAQTLRNIPWALNPSGYQTLPYIKPGWAYSLALPTIAGQTVRIRVDSPDSNDVDPIAAIIDSNGMIVAGGDNSGDNRNSELEFTPQDGLTYTLIISTIDSTDGSLLTVMIEVEDKIGRFELLQTLTPTHTPTHIPTRTPPPTATQTNTPTPVPTSTAIAIPTAVNQARLQAQDLFVEGYRAWYEDNSEMVAVSTFKRAADADPAWPYVYLAQWDVSYSREDWFQLEEYLTQAMVRGFNDPFAFGYIQRSYARFMLNDFDGSLDDAERAIEIAPFSSQAWLEHGRALAAHDRYVEAIESLLIAQHIEPDSGAISFLLYTVQSSALAPIGDLIFQQTLANALLGTRGEDYIEELYGQSIRSAQTDEQRILAYFNRGLYYISQGRYDEAEANSDTIDTLAGNSALSQSLDGQVTVARGKFQDALPFYDYAYMLAPENTDVMIQRFYLRQQLGIAIWLGDIERFINTGSSIAYAWTLDETGQATMIGANSRRYDFTLQGEAGDKFTIQLSDSFGDPMLNAEALLTDQHNQPLIAGFYASDSTSDTPIEAFILPYDGVYVLKIAVSSAEGAIDLKVIGLR